MDSISSECSSSNYFNTEAIGELVRKIPKYTRLLIILFPFITFMGSFFSFMNINISYVYSFIIMIHAFFSTLKKKYSNIWIQVSFFALLIFHSFASLIWSEYSSIGITILFPLITGFTAMMFVASLDRIEFQFFLKIFSYFTLFVLTISLYEIFTGKYMLFNNMEFINRTNYYYLHYPGVVFTNPNDLAQYLIVGFPILIFQMFDKGKNVIIPILLLMVTIFVMMNTSSRLSIIAFFILIMIYIFFSLIRQKRFIIKLISISCVVIIILAFLTFLGVELPNIVDNYLRINTSEGYYTGRSVIYSRVYELGIKDTMNMIIGAGLGGSYIISEIGPHNMLLFIFADLGIIFAIGFIITLLYSFLKLVKYVKIKMYGTYLASAMISLIIVFPIFSSISSANEQRKIIWIALGLFFATIKNYKEMDLRQKNYFKE